MTHASASNAFDDIAALEKTEAIRVEDAIAALATKEQKAAEELQLKAKTEEESLNASVAQDIDAYKKEELAPLLEREKRATAEAVQSLESGARKKMPGVVEKLTKKLLEPSFLTR